MADDPTTNVTTLTFDIFGTVLDLSGMFVPACEGFLEGRGASLDGAALWTLWRARQRVEQYQDTLLGNGYSGYLEGRKADLDAWLKQQQGRASAAERMPVAIRSFVEDFGRLDVRVQKARLQEILKAVVVDKDTLEVEFRA